MPGTLNVGGHNIITHSGTSGAGTVDADNIDTVNIGNNALVVDSSGNVGVGTSSPTSNAVLHLKDSNTQIEIEETSGSNSAFINFDGTNLQLSTSRNMVDGVFSNTSKSNATVSLYGSAGGSTIRMYTSAFDNNTGVERMRIDSTGNVLVGKDANDDSAGIVLNNSGLLYAVRTSTVAEFNRLSNAGTIVEFAHNSTLQGTISVSGSTVSYNAFTGAHWSRLLDSSKPDIPRGTILESLDEMMDWVKEDGTLEDDIKHVKCKISDTVDSKNVYGLFFAWDDEDHYNDLQVAQVGSFVIRIHSSQDVQRGDLIQSNGDGTGKIQADDIIRSSTVAKVISNHRVETYEDGSYIVPCVIHC